MGSDASDEAQAVDDPASAPDPARRFKTAGDATKELHDSYGEWTASLGKHGVQFAFALMAANWALHGAHSAILQNRFATWSMLVAIIYLGLTLSLTGVMVALRHRQHRYATSDKERWNREFAKHNDPKVAGPWPYTESMESIGATMQCLHLIAPIVSGVLLIVSALTPSPAMPPAQLLYASGDGPSCCQSIADDLSGIRQAIESGKLSPQATPPNRQDIGLQSGPTSREETRIEGPSWLVVICVVCGLLGGGAILLRSGSATAKALGASLITVGTITGGGFALVKEVKIDKVFSFDISSKGSSGPGGSTAMPSFIPERLGVIDHFKIGDDRVLKYSRDKEESIAESLQFKTIEAKWSAGQSKHKDAILILVGAADRLPLRGAKRDRFDANIGLARARAESVRGAMVDWCTTQGKSQCAFPPNQVLVLTSGPGTTPPVTGAVSDRPADGFPEDRRVEAWVIWTDSSPQQTPK